MPPNRTLYLPGRSSYLAERWLLAHGDSGPVELLAPRSCEKLARSLQQKFSAISNVLILTEPDEPGRTPGERDASANERVILPVSFATLPLRHFPETRIPDIAPYYAFFRQLWELGFREFEFCNLSGTLRLSVPHLLDEFKDRHKGERCFVAGNGPSLNAIDMGRLKDEITLGSNRCYLGFEKWGFPFTYWAVSDWLQVEQYGQEYEVHIPRETTKFFSFEYLPLLHFDNACPVNVCECDPYLPLFSDACEKLYMGSSVTYMLIQIAAVMGCDPIILVGVDHRYDLKKAPPKQRPIIPRKARRALRRLERLFQGTIVEDVLEARRKRKAVARRTAHTAADYWDPNEAGEPTHFDARYAAGEAKRFTIPHMEWATAQYECAAQWGKENGVRILNGTPGTALKVFPLVTYDDLF